LDIDTILQSVEKTGRCVIIHEGAKTVGVGAEIMAQIMENSMDSLLAPVQRVTGYDIVMPYFQLEKHYIPSVARIKQSIISIME
jgi:pyruvate dehydrogenase E1 component beta subunit